MHVLLYSACMHGHITAAMYRYLAVGAYIISLLRLNVWNNKPSGLKLAGIILSIESETACHNVTCSANDRGLVNEKSLFSTTV